MGKEAVYRQEISEVSFWLKILSIAWFYFIFVNYFSSTPKKCSVLLVVFYTFNLLLTSLFNK